jgi:hypothetical protein
MKRLPPHVLAYLGLQVAITGLAAAGVGSLRADVELVPIVFWLVLVSCGIAGWRWAWVLLSGFAMWAGLIVAGSALESPVDLPRLFIAGLLAAQAIVLVSSRPIWQRRC